MSLIEDLDQLEAKAKEMIEGAVTVDALEQARVALLGRKGEITSVMHMMGKVAPEERPVLGKRANELRRLAESLLERRGGALKREAMRNLKLTCSDPFELIAWRDIYACLENCCDACEKVADAVEEVVMKNT